MELGAVLDFVGVAIRSIVIRWIIIRSIIEAWLVRSRSAGGKIFLAQLFVHAS
jgi:hypothetical protein